MAIAKDINCNLYGELEQRFLYNNDFNSIHILLNLYDLDKNIKNIHPKYISLGRMKKNIEKVFILRDDRREISSKLSKIFHEDINRLELFICIEGYKEGFFNKRLANSLENLTINNISIDKLYNKKYLYHFDSTNREIENGKNLIFTEIQAGFEKESISELISHYINMIIEEKLEKIDKILNLKEKLNIKEVDKIRNIVVDSMMESISEIYKESYWYGLNDRVLKRYR